MKIEDLIEDGKPTQKFYEVAQSLCKFHKRLSLKEQAKISTTLYDACSAMLPSVTNKETKTLAERLFALHEAGVTVDFDSSIAPGRVWRGNKRPPKSVYLALAGLSEEEVLSKVEWAEKIVEGYFEPETGLEAEFNRLRVKAALKAASMTKITVQNPFNAL